jgi:CubicO group peptidase (beta-lactamase class C family)
VSILPFSPRMSAIAVSCIIGMAGTALAQPATIQLGATPPEDAVRLAPGGLERALATLPETVADILRRSGVPGAAVAVVHGGQTVFSAGFGVREVDREATVEPGTVFQVASLSKPITATIVALQVAAGVVSWDDPAVRYLRGLQLSDPYVTNHATIGDFLAHRTGLPEAIGDELEDLGYGRGDIIARLRLAPLDPFRRSYHYANFGFTIGAEAVAAASREGWDELAERVLYQPLGMRSTSSRHADFLARDNRALLHVLEGGRFQPLYDRNPDAQSPAGGVSSNVLDLAEWMKLLLRKHSQGQQPLLTVQALLPALQPQAFSAQPHSLASRPGFYGYGFNVGVHAGGRTAMGHSGAFLLGAGTNFQILPSADLGVVVLTNGGPVGAAEAISATFVDTVEFGAPTRDWFAAYNGQMMGMYALAGDLAGAVQPASPQPALSAESFAGRYENAYFGQAEITAERGKVTLILGPRRLRFPLSHWDANVFTFAPNSENAPKGSLSSVRFVQEEGKVMAFTVDFLNDHGLGSWRR